MTGIMFRGLCLCSKTDDAMRFAAIFLIVLLSFPGVRLSGENVIAGASHDPADTSVAVHGRIVPMKGAFLAPLNERDSVLIADQLRYGFTLRMVDEGTGLELPEWKNSREGGVMAVSPWVIDTLKVTGRKKDGPRQLDLQGSIVITSFDEGDWLLPEIVLRRHSADGVTDTLVFEPMMLQVKTMPVDTASFRPHDIKGQVRYPVTFREILPWILGIQAFAALVILAVCLILMYRRRQSPENVRREPAHIVALRRLDTFRGNKMWAPEKQKAFYSGITDTLREYIASRYGIGAMEMTTAEIFGMMKDTDAPGELLGEVRELFERADFVKFAKHVASDEENASALPVAVRFVTETYRAGLENMDAPEDAPADEPEGSSAAAPGDADEGVRPDDNKE